MRRESKYDSVLEIIHRWPAEQRVTLIRDVLKTLEPQDEPRHIENTLQLARGLLATNQSPPSDEDIARWLEEYRLEKYS